MLDKTNFSRSDRIRPRAVAIDPGIGPVALQGTLSVSPTATTAYTLTASGSGGTAGTTVTVAVIGSPAPQPPGSFGEKYQDLIPADATVEQHDPKRFALVTGLVQDVQGQPLAEVLAGLRDGSLTSRALGVLLAGLGGVVYLALALATRIPEGELVLRTAQQMLRRFTRHD